MQEKSCESIKKCSQIDKYVKNQQILRIKEFISISAEKDIYTFNKYFELLKSLHSNNRINQLIYLKVHNLLGTIIGVNNFVNPNDNLQFWELNNPPGSAKLSTYPVKWCNSIAKIDNNTIITTDQEETIKCWDIRDHTQLWSIDLANKKATKCMLLTAYTISNPPSLLVFRTHPLYNSEAELKIFPIYTDNIYKLGPALKSVDKLGKEVLGCIELQDGRICAIGKRANRTVITVFSNSKRGKIVSNVLKNDICSFCYLRNNLVALCEENGNITIKKCSPQGISTYKELRIILKKGQAILNISRLPGGIMIFVWIWQLAGNNYFVLCDTMLNLVHPLPNNPFISKEPLVSAHIARKTANCAIHI